MSVISSPDLVRIRIDHGNVTSDSDEEESSSRFTQMIRIHNNDQNDPNNTTTTQTQPTQISEEKSNELRDAHLNSLADSSVQLVTLASADSSISYSESPPVRFQPQPLPALVPRPPLVPSSDASPSDVADGRPTLKRPHTIGHTPRRRQEPASDRELMRTSPKLLASLNSGFTYQHSTFHDSPLHLEQSMTPMPDNHLRRLQPSSSNNVGGGTTKQRGPSRRAHVRFGSDDWTTPEKHTNTREVDDEGDGGGDDDGADENDPHTHPNDPNLPTTHTAASSATSSSDPQLHHPSIRSQLPKHLRLKRTTSKVKSTNEFVQVSHIGGKTITTISRRIVQPTTTTTSSANGNNNNNHNDVAGAGTSNITTVLGKKVRVAPKYMNGSSISPATKSIQQPMTPNSKSSDGGNGNGGTTGSTAPRLTWLQFRYIFTLLTLFQCGLCCGIVWYLGYKNSVDTGRVLANLARASITHHIEDEMNGYAENLLRAADGLANMFGTRFPELTTLGGLSLEEQRNLSLIHRPGILTDMSYQLSAYPNIPLFGISMVNHLHYAVRRSSSTTSSLTSGSHFFQLMDPGLSLKYGDTTMNKLWFYQFDRARWYEQHPQTDQANNPRFKNRISFFQPVSDFNPYEDPLEMLGEPIGSIAPFINIERPWFQKALKRGTSELMWSDVDRLIVPDSPGFLGTSVLKPVYDNLGDFEQPPKNASGKLSYVVFATFYLPYIRDAILQDLKNEVGESGCVVLVEGSGLLVATTLEGFENEYQQRTQLLTSEDSFLWHIIDVIGHVGFFQIGTNPTNDTITQQQERYVAEAEFQRLHPKNLTEGPSLPYTFPSSEPINLHHFKGGLEINNVHFMIGRSDWHLNARTLKLPGLNWIVIVATKDSDWDGGLASTREVTGWFTALVAVTSALLSLGLAHCISRPMMRLVTFMENVSERLHRKKDHTATTNGGGSGSGGKGVVEYESTTMEELSQMCQDWKDVMMTLQRGGSRNKSQSSGGSNTSHTRSSPSGNASSSDSESHDCGIESSNVTSDDDGSGRDDATGGRRGGGIIGGVDPKRGHSISKSTGILNNTLQALSAPPPGSPTNMNVNPGETQMVSLKPTSSTAASSSSTTGPKDDKASSSPPPSHPTRTKPKKSAASRLASFYQRHAPSCLREFPMRETQLLSLAFGSMLESLRKNHQQLQIANESKRKFIRYIFHEVRVPFNAIVLGVEQLREDLYTEPLRSVEEMQDIVNILNEQSKVVARILNDVLSLQKIEDGALELDMSPFNMLEMVCGTLRSFQPLFTEKKLTLLTDLQSLEECLTTHARQVWKRWYDSLKDDPTATFLHGPLAGEEECREDDEDNENDNDEDDDEDENEEDVDQRSTASTTAIPRRQRVQHPKRKVSFSQSSNGNDSLLHISQGYAHDVLGDRYRLRQVLANFLSNAVKFSPTSSSVTVSVTCQTIESEEERQARRQAKAQRRQQRNRCQHTTLDVADGHGKEKGTNTTEMVPTTDVLLDDALLDNPRTIYLSNGLTWTPPEQVLMRVSVRDSGRGLSHFEQQQLFQPYMQLTSGEQQEGKGTGLGLNISKSLVELSGGIIGVSSSGVNGQGCEFFFELPMEVCPSRHGSNSASPQVFHVADPRGPATIRAWHGASGGGGGGGDGSPVAADGAGGNVNSAAAPSIGVGSSSVTPPALTVSSGSSGSTPDSTTISGVGGGGLSPSKKNSPSTFSLQGIPHTTNAPLTVTVRQRMLERSHAAAQSQSMSNLFDRRELPSGYHLSEFSPLVGSSRRILPPPTSSSNSSSSSRAGGIGSSQPSHGSLSIADHIHMAPSLHGSVSNHFATPPNPSTPGTLQIHMMSTPSSSSSFLSTQQQFPTTHLSKLALLHGLANESAGYGFGYSSRPTHQTRPSAHGIGNIPAHTPTTAALTSGSAHSTHENDVAPVLMPMDDDPDDRRPSLHSPHRVHLPPHLRPLHSITDRSISSPSNGVPTTTTSSSAVAIREPSFLRSRSHHHIETESKMMTTMAMMTMSNDVEGGGSSFHPSSNEVSRTPSPYPLNNAPNLSPRSRLRRTADGVPHRKHKRTPTTLTTPIEETTMATTSYTNESDTKQASSSSSPPVVPSSSTVESLNHRRVPSSSLSVSTNPSALPVVGFQPSSPSGVLSPMPLLTSPSDSGGDSNTFCSPSPLNSPIDTTTTMTMAHTPELPTLPANIIAIDGGVQTNQPISTPTPSPPPTNPSTITAAMATTSSASSTSTPPFRPRILVVEDSAPNRKLLVMLLRALKCEVVGVENGLLAVQEFAPWARADWIGSNIGGREEREVDDTSDLQSSTTHGSNTMGDSTVSSSPLPPSHDPSDFISPSTAASSAELLKLGVSPNGSDSPIESSTYHPHASSISPHARVIRSNFDAVLMDGNMPIMNGIDATRNIRALGIEIPIIAVTGNALEEDVQSFLQAGVQKILTKPVARSILQATLKEYLPRFVVATSAVQAKMKTRMTK